MRPADQSVSDVPALFSTYAEAWARFVDAEAMESFPDQYPEREAHLLSWYIPVAAEGVASVLDLQRTLVELDGMVAIPPERLHVSVVHATWTEEPDLRLEDELLRRARGAWAGEPSFVVELSSVNVFPTAVVVEVHGDGPARLLDRLLESGYWRGLPGPAPDRGVFLPHLTVAIAVRRRPAPQVRKVVEGHRGDRFGVLDVDNVALCRIPVARSRLLQPWTVVGRIPLGNPAGATH